MDNHTHTHKITKKKVEYLVTGVIFVILFFFHWILCVFLFFVLLLASWSSLLQSFIKLHAAYIKKKKKIVLFKLKHTICGAPNGKKYSFCFLYILWIILHLWPTTTRRRIKRIFFSIDCWSLITTISVLIFCITFLFACFLCMCCLFCFQN